MIPPEWRNEGGDICALYAESRLRSVVLYCDDIAVLTVHFNAQSYF
jgi:hypothetical protein